MIHESPCDLLLKSICLPSMYAVSCDMSLTRLFGIQTSTYPCVPEGPDARKLSCLLVELNANSVMVELEFTVNTMLLASLSSARLTTLVAAFMFEVASEVALIRQLPVASGSQTAEKLPSDAVFTKVKLSHESPPFLLQARRIGAPLIASPLRVNLPLISACNWLLVVVPLQVKSMFGVGRLGVGLFVGLAVGLVVGEFVGLAVGAGSFSPVTQMFTIVEVSESSIAIE